MRRWLAVLILGFVMNAQVSALACPVAHHADTDARGSAHPAHSAATSTSHEPVGTGPGAPHGDDATCTMALSCAAVALIESMFVPFITWSEREIRVPVPAQPHAKPSLVGLTPPPRLA